MSGCGCIVADYGDPVDDWREGPAWAGQTLQCSECGAEILIGRRFQLVEYTDDDEPGRRFHCLDCVSIIDEFFCEGVAFGRVWDDVLCHVEDTEGEISSDCLLRLTPKARSAVLGYINDVFTDLDDDPDDDLDLDDGGAS